MGYAVLILLLLIMLVLIVLRKLKELNQKERVQIRKIRDSALYNALKPMLERARDRTIASVMVTTGEVSIRFLDPAIPAETMRFQEAGLGFLDERVVLSLTQAIGEEISCLQDEKQYNLIEKRVRSQDGTEQIALMYEIRMDRKAQLLGKSTNRR